MNGKDYADQLASNYLGNIKIALTALLEEGEREGYTTAKEYEASIRMTLKWVDREQEKG